VIEVYKSFRHGYAVASGIELAAKFSLARGLITPLECNRIIALLKSFRLLRMHNIPDDQMRQLVLRDKKKAGNDLYFVFLNGIGKAVVEKISAAEAVEFYRDNKPGT
jgi:3-dehydroquinate synthase